MAARACRCVDWGVQREQGSADILGSQVGTRPKQQAVACSSRTCHTSSARHKTLTMFGPHMKASGTATPYADHNSPLAMFMIAKGMYSDAELFVANTSASTLSGAV